MPQRVESLLQLAWRGEVRAPLSCLRRDACGVGRSPTLLEAISMHAGLASHMRKVQAAEGSSAPAWRAAARCKQWLQPAAGAESTRTPIRSQMRGVSARTASLERVCTASCTWSSSLRAARVACLPHFPEQQQRLLLSFECRVCRRACCTRRRSRPMLVACGSPHSYRVHVQTLVDIGMLQALVACSCRTCGVSSFFLRSSGSSRP